MTVTSGVDVAVGVVRETVVLVESVVVRGARLVQDIRGYTLPPDLFWAGALCGCVLFGLLSFVIFKVCVMTYTSLQGAGMLVVGALGLMMKYPTFGTSLSKTMTLKPFVLPVAIFIPTLLGLIYQHSGPAPAGAKPGGPPKK